MVQSDPQKFKLQRAFAPAPQKSARFPVLDTYSDEEWAEYHAAKADNSPEAWAHYYRNWPIAQEHFAEHYRVRENDLDSFQRYIRAVPEVIRARILTHQIIYENGVPRWIDPEFKHSGPTLNRAQRRAAQRSKT